MRVSRRTHVDNCRALFLDWTDGIYGRFAKSGSLLGTLNCRGALMVATPEGTIIQRTQRRLFLLRWR